MGQERSTFEKHIKQEAINTGTVVNLDFSAVAAGNVNAGATVSYLLSSTAALTKVLRKRGFAPNEKRPHM